MQFSFRKPHFWHPDNFAKTLFWHKLTRFVFIDIPRNTIKRGKNLDQFLTYSFDQFLTYRRPNLGPVFNSTAYIYIDLEKGVFFLRALFSQKQSDSEHTTEIITNDPSSAIQFACPCAWHALGWNIRPVMALTQQVPQPVRIQSGCRWGSMVAPWECLGTCHPRVWTRKPCKSLNQNQRKTKGQQLKGKIVS